MRRSFLRIIAICGLLSSPAVHAGFQPELSDLDILPLHVTSPQVVAKAIGESRQRQDSGPALFAVTTPLPVSLAGGVWDQPAAGISRWRTRVYSPDARALMMEFGRFALPAGAELRIHDVSGKSVQGPYGAAHNSARGKLWTAMVRGDTAVIELQVPTERRSAVVLELARVAHAWRDPRAQSDIGSSTECEINVACPLGNAWGNQIRATVKLQVPVDDSVGVCTGTLVNNLAEDGKPYILTAHHCEIRDGNAAGVVVYWNFENSSCSGAADASDAQNITGTTVVAQSQDFDMALLQASSEPPAAFGTYYAGIDATGAAFASGVGIHHPAGDVKKISEFTTAPDEGPAGVDGGYENVPAYIVTWSQGVTEPGSSGSALWNAEGLIVGLLSGGASECADRSLTDSYARVGEQWLGGGTANSQLKAWLDPANSGALRIVGKDASALGTTPTATPAPTATPVPTDEPEDPEDEGGGGGGAGSPLMLAVLAALAAWRRRRPL